MKEREPSQALIVARWPQKKTVDTSLVEGFEMAAEVISGIRTIRKEKNIPLKEVISLSGLNKEEVDTKFDAIIHKLGNLDGIQHVESKLKGASTYAQTHI